MPCTRPTTLQPDEPYLDTAEINGIAWKSPSQAFINAGWNTIENIDALPMPAYDLAKWERYAPSAHRDLGRPFLPLITARGCPNSCSYCVVHGRYRLHSIEYIDKLLRASTEMYDAAIRNIIVWDDTFTVPEGRCNRLAELFFQYGAGYTINTSTWFWSREQARILKDSGCEVVFFGVESCDPDVLKNFGRRTTPREIEKAFRIARDCEILTVGSVMVGTPYDTRETIERNVNYLIENIQPDLAFFSHFAATPGSACYRECVIKGVVPPYRDWLSRTDSEFCLTPPPYTPSANRGLSKNEIDELVNWAYRRFYTQTRMEMLYELSKGRSFLKGAISRIERAI